MKNLMYPISFTLAMALLTLFAGNSYATTISYQAIDLPDTTIGQDLWQYSYSTSGYTFNQDYGFTIFFDYSLYSTLEDPPPLVNSDWDPIVWQPNVLGDGAYDALALVDNASLADPFRVSFVWSGSGTPGPQAFEIYYYLRTEDIVETLETGQTTSGVAAIPEPATLLLLGSGLIGLKGIRKKLRIRA